jgi:uncharacterized protein (DUF433 family)
VPTTVPSLIALDDQGVAYIQGTTTKVIQVALDRIAQGWDAEEIHAQHPDLSLAQIHAALSYYYEHQDELDADIERRYQQVERLRAQTPPRLTRQELEERLNRKTNSAPVT